MAGERGRARRQGTLRVAARRARKVSQRLGMLEQSLRTRGLGKRLEAFDRCSLSLSLEWARSRACALESSASTLSRSRTQRETSSQRTHKKRRTRENFFESRQECANRISPSLSSSSKQAGSVGVMELLLEKVRDPAQRWAVDKQRGWTPLHYAQQPSFADFFYGKRLR